VVSLTINNMNEDIKTEQIEVNEIIAERVPPGDKWKLVDGNIIHRSLMDVLEAYFIETQFKGSFRLSPREGKIYAIKTQEKVIPPKIEKKFNIYGESSF
jgi:hypothetical protein